MSNMSYCRFQNTLNDFRDCAYEIDGWDSEESDNLSYEEKGALRELVIEMQDILANEDIIEEMLKFEGI